MTQYKPEYDSSHALVVAIDEYNREEDKLHTAVRGASSLAEVLQNNFDFSVTRLFNEHATRENIISWFTNLQCKEDDRVLFYFAGHGTTRTLKSRDHDDGYLVLANTENIASALKLDDITYEADDLRAKHVLLIIDACFSGLLLNNRAYDMEQEPDIEKLSKKLLSRKVRFAITAGGKEVVDDSSAPDGQNSIFTYYLLKGLQGECTPSSGLLRAQQLAPYLEEHVSGSRRSKHKPNFGRLEGSGDGDFIFTLPEYFVEEPDATEACVVLDPHDLLDAHQTMILQKLIQVAEVKVIETVTTGQSGSAVFIVLVKGRSDDGPTGLHFCKIYRTPSGYERKTHEKVLETAIKDYVPALAAYTDVVKNWMASVYAVAHSATLQGSRPLAKLLLRKTTFAHDNIDNLLKILTKWNPTPDLRTSQPYELLREPLKQFGSEGNIDRVGETIEKHIEVFLAGLKSDRLYIMFDQQTVLPNPIAFMSRPELWEKERYVVWPCGNIHGDLHTNNILCLDRATDTVYPVITDFDTYDSANNLFFDLAYLELDISMRMLDPDRIFPSDDPDELSNRDIWQTVSPYLTEQIQLQDYPPSLHAKSIPLNYVLTPIRNLVAQMCSQSPDMEIAFWLARTSAGLAFARKRKVSSGWRTLALLLAAQSLKKTLDEYRIRPIEYKQPYWIDWLEQPETES